LNIPATAFLSGGRDARPPGNAHFQGEKAVPGTANLPIGVVKSLTQKVREPKLFSRHSTRTKHSFSILNCGFQVYPYFYLSSHNSLTLNNEVRECRHFAPAEFPVSPAQ
jgi:hypothetical protein